MSCDTKSVMNSAVSISGAKTSSDAESTSGVGGNKASVTTRNSRSNLFNPGDGNLHIVVRAHKVLVKRFTGLKTRIKNGSIILKHREPEEETFSNTFKILYASEPNLRASLIPHRGKEPAYLELREQDEAIKISETGVLGLEAVVHVAKIREKGQRRRGKKKIDTAEELKSKVVKDQADGPNEAESITPAITSSKLDSAKRTAGKGEKATQTMQEPCFIDFPALSPKESKPPYSCAPIKRYKIDRDVQGCGCSS
ncbi:hypothetical protein BDV93DRAFT_511764 [Ceratobasidium sp. AG-I]|nr:hypothetical protein BDV93DRAFT_511764 [Ceratobasidium sp. AG-I]